MVAQNHLLFSTMTFVVLIMLLASSSGASADELSNDTVIVDDENRTYIPPANDGYVIANSSILTLTNYTKWSTIGDTNSMSVYASDVDNDGSMELVTGGSTNAATTAELRVWNYASGMLSLKNLTTWRGGVSAVYVSDVDNDGTAEIITAGNTAASPLYSQLRVWNYTNGRMNLESSVEWSPSPSRGASVTSVYVADADGDGTVEIITGGYYSPIDIWSQLRIWNHTGGRTLNLEASIEWKKYSHALTFSVYASDVDSDGIVEIFTAGFSGVSPDSSQLGVWNYTMGALNNETLVEWAVGLHTNAYSVYVSDVDNDGTMEIVTGGYIGWVNNNRNAELKIWNYSADNLNTERSTQWNPSGMPTVGSVYVSDADGDGDGKKDILTFGSFSNGTGYYGQLRIWNWNGSVMFLEKSDDWLEASGVDVGAAESLKVADLDGDGTKEIIMTGSVGAWPNRKAFVRVYNIRPEHPAEVCGNNICGAGETESSCPQDCLVTQLDKLDTSPTACWNETCDFGSSPANFKIDNRYLTLNGTILTVGYNNWQESVPFTKIPVSIGLQKRINATGLGKKQVYLRVNAPNLAWWMMLSNSSGGGMVSPPEFSQNKEWSNWHKLDLSPDVNNTLKLMFTDFGGEIGLKIQYLVIDPDRDFPIFAVPVNYHLTDPQAISDSRFESRVNTNITNLLVTKVWKKLPDLKNTSPSRIKPIPLSKNCAMNIVSTSSSFSKKDLDGIELCVKNTEFKIQGTPNGLNKGRIVGLDSRDNWETNGIGDVGGFTWQNDYRVFVDNDGGPVGSNSSANRVDFPAGTAVMHELGHTWGLWEEYTTDVSANGCTTNILELILLKLQGRSIPNDCTNVCLIGTNPKCAGNPIIFDDLNGDGFPNDIVSDLGTGPDHDRLKPNYLGTSPNSKYNATDIMGLDSVDIQSENVSKINFKTLQKEFNEVNLKHVQLKFWNELTTTGKFLAMMRIKFLISENGTFSLLSSKVEDGYYGPPMQAEPSNQTYLLQVYSANNTLLYNQTFRPEFQAFGDREQPTSTIESLAIPYLDDATTFRIDKQDATPVFNLNVQDTFCNKNDVCGTSENYISCQSDCPSGSKDGYCDGLNDGIADPDCSVWQDPDYSCNNNNICEPYKNENALTCPSDCQLWAQDGVCPVFTDLRDGHCDPDCGSKDPDCAGQTGWNVFMTKTKFSLNLGETEAVPIPLTNLDQQENRSFDLSVTGIVPSIYNLSFDVITIPAGETRGIALTLAPSSCLLNPTIYNFSILVKSENKIKQLNASLEIKPTRKVSLSAQPDGQELEFSQNTYYSLRIGNFGNIDDSYSLSASTYPEGPKFEYPQAVDVPACADKTVNLTVLPTGCSVKPNNYTISASLVSQSDPQAYASGVTVLGIVPEVNKVHASLIPAGQQANPGKTVGYSLNLKNEGNVDQNLTTTITYPDLPTSVFWTWTRNMTGWISPVQQSNSLEACGQASLTFNTSVPKDWPGFNETVYQFSADTIFSGQIAKATVSLQVNATFNSSMFYKIETVDYLLGRLDQLKQQDTISKQDYNLLRKQYARIMELGETALYGKIAGKNARDKDDEDERETENELGGLNKDEREELQDLEKEYSNDFQNHAPLKDIRRDVLLTYLIDKQLLLKQNLSEKARCHLPRQKYCDTSWTSEFLLYNKYIRGSDFKATMELLEQQKFEVTQELAGSTCKEKQKQAASKLINKGNSMLSSLNLSIDMDLKEFLKENKKTGQILESYMAAHNILDNCRGLKNER